MRVALEEDAARAAAASGGQHQLQLGLPAVEQLHGNGFGISPLDARDVLGGAVEPHRLARLHCDNPHAHARVGVARLGVALEVHRRVERHLVGKGIGGHRRLVGFQKSNAAAVGRPVVAGAQAELLRVHPVQVAVQEVLVAAAGELSFLAARCRHQPKVVLIDEAEPVAIGRKFWVPHAALCGRQRLRFPAGQVVEVELPAAGEEDGLPVRSPVVGSHGVAGQARPLALVGGGLLRRGRQVAQLLVVDQHALLARLDVNHPQVAPPLVTPQDVAQASAVRAPAELGRHAAGQAAAGKDSLDGERLLPRRGSLLLRRKRRGSQQDKQENQGKHARAQLHGLFLLSPSAEENNRLGLPNASAYLRGGAERRG